MIEDLQKKYNGNFLIENNLNLSVKNSILFIQMSGQVWGKNLNKVKELKILEITKV